MDDNHRTNPARRETRGDNVDELELRPPPSGRTPPTPPIAGQDAYAGHEHGPETEEPPLLPPLPPSIEPDALSGQPGSRGRRANQGAEATEKPLSGFAAGFILLAEGYASLSAEVMALRMMVAHAGTGVITTSILLAAYLTALGVGYARGERLARRTIARGGRLREKIGFRLAAAAAWTALWISDIGRIAAFEGTAAFGDMPMLVNVGIYSTGASITGYLLAQTVCLVHYARQPRQPPAPSARRADPSADAQAAQPARIAPAWTISTIGNVIGTLVTSMVILTVWGVAAALGSIAALLLLATLMTRPRKLPATSMTAAALLIAVVVVIDIETYIDRTAYADYIITHETPESDARLLIINNSRASRDDPAGTGWSYIEWTETDFCESGGGRILVLGAAGRTFGRGVDEAECRIEPLFIDIDGAQEALSKEFLHGEPPGPLTVDDARRYLAGQAGWDAILADAYNRTDHISDHLVTREFFQATRNALKNDGLLYVNIITRPDDGNLRYETRVDRTIRSVYAHCRQNAAGDAERPWSNLVYRCRRSTIDGDSVIYSDMRVSAEIDTGLPLLLPQSLRNEP